MANRKEKRKKTFTMVLSISLAALMVLSIGGYIVNSISSNSQSSNKFKLTYSGKDFRFEGKLDSYGNPYYEVTTDDRMFTAFYLPEQLSYIQHDDHALNLIKDSYTFWITFDPETADLTSVDFLRYDLRRNLPSSKYFTEGILKEDAQYQLPIIDCSNATLYNPVIVLENSNTTQINSEDSCITIKFSPYDVTKIRDIIIYLSEGIDIGDLNGQA